MKVFTYQENFFLQSCKLSLATLRFITVTLDWKQFETEPEKWLHIPLHSFPLHYYSPSRSAAEKLVALLYQKLLVMVLELFACKYMNHKWQKSWENVVNPDNSQILIPSLLRFDLSTCSAMSWVQCLKTKYVTQRLLLQFGSTDQVTIEQMSSVLYQCQQLQEKGFMCSSAFYWREHLVFCPLTHSAVAAEEIVMGQVQP